MSSPSSDFIWNDPIQMWDETAAARADSARICWLVVANSKNPERKQDWYPMFARELDKSSIACYFGLLGKVILQIDSKISYPMIARVILWVVPRASIICEINSTRT